MSLPSATYSQSKIVTVIEGTCGTYFSAVDGACAPLHSPSRSLSCADAYQTHLHVIPQGFSIIVAVVANHAITNALPPAPAAGVCFQMLEH